MNDLEGICRNQSVPKWETIEEDIRCEICLVNEKMEVRFEGHDDDSPIQRACTKQIRICCSCMRNSYINPVKCHTCGETIQPFINANWGAILVAGYDRKAGKVLQNDIKKFKEVITSKVLPAMCINPDNVIILAEDMHGITADKLDGAFDDLSKKDIRTLLFVYSGHHGDYGFQLGPNVYYDLNKVSERINKWNEGKPKFGKVIAFLDCCVPDKLNLNKILKLIQFNATSPTTTADLDTTKGSPFLMYVMQAFTARANGDICIHKGCKCSKHIRGDFITINDLWEYLNEHTKNENLKPFINITNIDMKGTILAYNYDFEVKFEFTLQWLDMETWKLYVLPKDFNDLKQLKLILAQEFLKHVYDINPEGSDARSKFAKIISLEIQTGPNTTIEIDSVELLVLYWTSKRQLRCVARRLQNVNVDIPVGRCFKNVPDILVVHQKILQQCEITEQQLTTSNLRKYRQELENNTGYDDYRKALEFSICHAYTQLLHNRLEISFFDLRKGLTMVYMNLKKTADIQENME
ncbi:uncharacterized protein LOC127851699 isoform X1 [Dreissena polymorpha]|uniref:Uncharacterized protein n=1 Tax=Dreissena polymorpha TaxID=45954 RepID=A0A9D4S2S5_DREPO|nr:uncharacterized protein LOC127851699 isoform X1 [Dreissena polymorpha]XP_052241521.1 uncharacterized protein LOC127851699 isoform X1 [Dreissena polymorpha]KAH3890429.1 hypothetical protein DPMN_014510 [Dreissena polymorpha]